MSQPLPPGCAYGLDEFFPLTEAKISVLDRGLLRSDTTYEVAHIWQGRFFRLDVPLDRFLASIGKSRLALRVSRDRLAEILAECVTRKRHRLRPWRMAAPRVPPRAPLASLCTAI